MRWLVLGFAVLLTGCATITKGTTQNIGINTPGAPGSSCTLTSAAVGSKTVVTPATLVVDKSQEAIAVRCQKQCFQDGATIIASNTETMAAGNVIAGGPIGLGIDAISGAMNKYNAQTDVVMVPVQGCRPTATGSL